MKNILVLALGVTLLQSSSSFANIGTVTDPFCSDPSLFIQDGVVWSKWSVDDCKNNHPGEDLESCLEKNGGIFPLNACSFATNGAAKNLITTLPILRQYAVSEGPENWSSLNFVMSHGNSGGDPIGENQIAVSVNGITHYHDAGLIQREVVAYGAEQANTMLADEINYEAQADGNMRARWTAIQNECTPYGRIHDPTTPMGGQYSATLGCPGTWDMIHNYVAYMSR